MRTQRKQQQQQHQLQQYQRKNQSNCCTGSFALEVVFKLDYKIRNMCEVERKERSNTLICADFISIVATNPQHKILNMKNGIKI